MSESSFSSHFVLPTSPFLPRIQHLIFEIASPDSRDRDDGHFVLPSSSFLLPTSNFLLPASYFLLQTPPFQPRIQHLIFEIASPDSRDLDDGHFVLPSSSFLLPTSNFPL
ncbi:MAG: hypothetical protein NXH89_19800, partial [Cyclobacteriaceae bacterium]|nr:hypothetical protein [Cyclobacteriaceae bacterium]